MIPQTPKGKRRFYRFGQDTDVPTEPFVALVPGHAAPLVHLTLPDGIKGRARDRIARLQITDSLGQGEDRLVMRPFMPTGVKHNWQRLCLTDRGRLSDWRTTAEGWGDRCEALLPDYLSLPAAADVWSLSIDGAMLVARLGLQDGFSAETALAEQLLLRALATEPPKAIYADTPLPPDLLAETEIKNIPVLSDPAAFLPLGLGPLETLSQGELSLDLAKDPEDAEDQIRRQLIPWIAPVALLTLAALLWAVSTIIDVRRITEATAQLNATTRQEIRTHFLPTEPILDMRTQVSRIVTTRLSGADTAETSPKALSALPLLRQATATLQRPTVAVQSLFYQEGNGLTVLLDLDSFADLDALILDLRGVDLRVLIEEASAREGSGVTAQLLIRDASAGGAP